MNSKIKAAHLNSQHDARFIKPWNQVGYLFVDLELDGKQASYQVVNERAVRAAAGLMLASAGVAFVLAYFSKIYLPIQIVTILAAFDFAVRLVSGLSTLSPFGALGNWLVRKQRPEWVGAAQKRFAWSLGLVMASISAFLVNTGLNGTLVQTLCMTCLTLMWMEATLGICLGCKIYDLALRLGAIPQPEVRPACPGGACALPARD